MSALGVKFSYVGAAPEATLKKNKKHLIQPLTTSKTTRETHRSSLLVFKIDAVKEPTVSIGQEVRQPLAYKPHLTATTTEKKKKGCQTDGVLQAHAVQDDRERDDTEVKQRATTGGLTCVASQL